MKGKLLALDFLDDLLGSGSDGVGSSSDSGIDSLGGGLDGLLDSSLGLSGLLGIVVAASAGSNHHRDDGDGHKYLFHS